MTAQINVVFDPPLLTDAPETFDAKAQDMGVKLNPWAGEANTLATEVNSNALAAAQSKTDAQTAASTATIQAGLAAGAVAAAASTWVSEGSYTINQLSWPSPSSGALYRCIQSHSGRSTPPDLDTDYWAAVYIDPDNLVHKAERGVTEGDITSDPSITTYPLILTNHANGPDAGTSYWYISTVRYLASGNMAQTAVSYAGTPARFAVRHYYSGEGWSAWREFGGSVLGADWSAEQSGTKLVFKYSGTAKMSLDAAGNLIVAGDITFGGAP